MDRKKGVLISGFLLVLLSVSFLSFVSADAIGSIKDTANNVIDNFLRPIAETVLGTMNPGELAGTNGLTAGELLFAKVLLFAILLAIVYSVVDKFPLIQDETWVEWVVAIPVSILAVRFLTTPQIIATILLPYSALGVAITALVPLIIFFIFVERVVPSKTLRKICWIFAAVVFMGLYYTRMDQLKDLAYLYPVAAALCIIFLFADGTIQKTWKKAQVESAHELHAAQRRSEIMQKRYELEQKRINNTVTDVDYNRINAALEKVEKQYGIK